MSSTTQVTMDTSANNKAKAVLSVLVLVFIALFAFGWVKDWDFLGMFWIGVAIVGFGGGLVGQLKGGGFAQAPCPSCGHTLEFVNPKDHRIEHCSECGAWSHGTDTMGLVPDDYVAEIATFTTPFKGEGMRWPRTDDDHLSCPVCAGHAELEELEVQDAGIGVMMGVGGKITTYKLKVPMCPEHKDGIDLKPDDDDDKKIHLVFRSRPYHLAYEALNS
ncbi:MAG: hypothetical protein VX899_22355 [Myxococcota bacterium]|nr:hypothetical protein [Myxococcota bacterium]